MSEALCGEGNSCGLPPAPKAQPATPDRRAGGVAAIRRACTRIPATEWGGFQLYYPMCEKDVREMSGGEIVAAVLVIFDEVVPAMNLVQSAPWLKNDPRPYFSAPCVTLSRVF